MLSHIDREHNSGGETEAVRRQTQTSGINPAGSSRAMRLDPLSLPLRFDARDVRERNGDAPFHASLDSKHAFENGLQSRDIETEQAQLRWADALILQFPMWWFSMPAIMKGWVERVYAYGFGYGVGEHSETHWGDRYGEGMMAGVTPGARKPAEAAKLLPVTPWGRYLKVLLSNNEFLYID